MKDNNYNNSKISLLMSLIWINMAPLHEYPLNNLLHPGYINCFKDAKNYCDKFIIFLQIDPSLHRKSKYKPVVPVYDRYKALMSIKYIDEDAEVVKMVKKT